MTEHETSTPVSFSAVALMLPLLGGMAMYSFEAGYLAHFEIPASFIQLTPATFAAGAITAVLCIALFNVCLYCSLKVAAGRGIITRSLIGGALSFPPYFLVFSLGSGLYAGWSALVIALLHIAGTYRAQKLGHPWTAFLTGKSEKVAPPFHAWSPGSLPDAFSTILAVALPLLFAAFTIGHFYAKSQLTFLVDVDSPHDLLIKRFDDTFIFRSVDDTGRKLVGPVRVKKIPSPAPLNLQPVLLPDFDHAKFRDLPTYPRWTPPKVDDGAPPQKKTE